MRLLLSVAAGISVMVGVEGSTRLSAGYIGTLTKKHEADHKRSHEDKEHDIGRSDTTGGGLSFRTRILRFKMEPSRKLSLFVRRHWEVATIESKQMVKFNTYWDREMKHLNDVAMVVKGSRVGIETAIKAALGSAETQHGMRAVFKREAQIRRKMATVELMVAAFQLIRDREDELPYRQQDGTVLGEQPVLTVFLRLLHEAALMKDKTKKDMYMDLSWTKLVHDTMTAKSRNNWFATGDAVYKFPVRGLSMAMSTLAAIGLARGVTGHEVTTRMDAIRDAQLPGATRHKDARALSPNNARSFLYDFKRTRMSYLMQKGVWESIVEWLMKGADSATTPLNQCGSVNTEGNAFSPVFTRLNSVAAANVAEKKEAKIAENKGRLGRFRDWVSGSGKLVKYKRATRFQEQKSA